MTNRQQLNRLKEPYRSQAFENIRKDSDYKEDALFHSIDYFMKQESRSFEDTLNDSFHWADSKEGYEYWDTIYDNPQNYLQDEKETT